MAKRRKEKDEEEDKPFKLPKFNEEEFIKKERINIKSTVISFLFGIFMAIICFGLWALMGPETNMRWPLVFLVGIANGAFLRYIFMRTNIDTSHFTKKNWFSSYAIYFISWLFIFIVLVNPPFYDAQSPYVEVAVLPGMQEPGGDIFIVAKITDNQVITKDDIQFNVNYPNGTPMVVDFTYEDDLFSYSYANDGNVMGEYPFTLTVVDKADHKNVYSDSFTFSNNTLDITSSIISGMRSGDTITIKAEEKISKKNFLVYYKIDNGSEINANRKDINDKEEYITSPKYEGWEENSNVTIKIYAEAIHYFVNIYETDEEGNVKPKKFSNIIEDTEDYIFITGTDNNIGTEDPPVTYNCSLNKQPENVINYDLPCPRYVATPGFEAIIFIIALLSVILIFKYRKKDRRKKR